MGTTTGRETLDLMTRLKAEPQRFSLGQALRLLGFAHARDAVHCHTFLCDQVRIRPWLSLAFPTSELLALEEEEDSFFVLTASVFGLYSTMGPLPTLYTEELLEEARADESVSRDFLDILNNHLYHLQYRAWHHNRLERRTIESHKQDGAHIQFCLMGQAAPALREPGLPRAFLTELLARRSLSASHMERYLNYAMGRDDVQVEQCVERRVSIPADQRCRLGLANAQLGEDAMLGCEIRDSTGKFRVHFLRVQAGDMRDFLPGHRGCLALSHHLRRALDAPLEYELLLHPAEGTIPQRRLGLDADVGFYLGSPAHYLPVPLFPALRRDHA